MNSSSGSAYSHQLPYANNVSAAVNAGSNKSSSVTGGYQSSAPQGYNNSNNSYSNAQQVGNTSVNSSYPTSASSNAYGSYANQSSNAYQPQSNSSVNAGVGVSTGSGSVTSIPSNNSRYVNDILYIYIFKKIYNTEGLTVTNYPSN